MEVYTPLVGFPRLDNLGLIEAFFAAAGTADDGLFPRLDNLGLIEARLPDELISDLPLISEVR